MQINRNHARRRRATQRCAVHDNGHPMHDKTRRRARYDETQRRQCTHELAPRWALLRSAGPTNTAYSLRRPSFTVQTLRLCTRETRASNYPPLAPACQWEGLARFTRTSSQRAATRGTLPSHVPCTSRCPFTTSRLHSARFPAQCSSK